jgi:glutamyl-tRNA reductase
VRNFIKFLYENNYHNFVIANRSLANAEALVQSFGGKAILLSDLENYTENFDALVSCTASEDVVITEALYNNLTNNDGKSRLVIDLALPADVDKNVANRANIQYVGMPKIQELAAANIEFREQALSDCEPLIEAGMRDLERTFTERQIELAMRTIPETIKDIRNTAMGSVFAKDLEKLDSDSREVLEKIIGYMEKKYISIPMKMAREVLLDAVSKN